MKKSPVRRFRMGRNAAVVLGFFVALVACAAPPAAALGTITVDPMPIPVTADQTSATVTVSWTGQPANTPIFMKVCGKSKDDPTFRNGIDCAMMTEVVSNGTATGSGSFQLDVFRGPDPSGDFDFGCYAPGDTVVDGYENRGCWIYLTNNTTMNNADAVELPLEFVSSGGEIPEAPIAILLPVTAAIVAAGGFMFMRQRQQAGSAA